MEPTRSPQFTRHVLLGDGSINRLVQDLLQDLVSSFGLAFPFSLTPSFLWKIKAAVSSFLTSFWNSFHVFYSWFGDLAPPGDKQLDLVPFLNCQSAEMALQAMV